MSMGETASRVCQPVYDTGQGQDERAPSASRPTTCAALTAMLGGQQPAPGVGNAVRAAADVGARKGQASRSAEKTIREPFGRLRWSRKERGFTSGGSLFR